MQYAVTNDNQTIYESSSFSDAVVAQTRLRAENPDKHYQVVDQQNGMVILTALCRYITQIKFPSYRENLLLGRFFLFCVIIIMLNQKSRIFFKKFFLF